MKRKLLAGLLSMCMIATLMPMTALAADPVEETVPVVSEETAPDVTEEVEPDVTEEPIPEIQITFADEDDTSAPDEVTPEEVMTEEPTTEEVTAPSPIALMALPREATSEAPEIEDSVELEEDPVDAEDYDVEINGQHFFNESGELTLGDGKITYDADAKTITVENVTVEVTDDTFIYASKTLTIILIGKNTVTLNTTDSKEGGNATAIHADENLTIKGDGSFFVKKGTMAENTDMTGIRGYHHILIDGTTIDIELSESGFISYGIEGSQWREEDDDYDMSETDNIEVKDSILNVKAPHAIFSENNVIFSGTTQANIESGTTDILGEKYGSAGVSANGKIIFNLAPGGYVTAKGGNAETVYGEGQSFPFAPAFLAKKGFEIAEDNSVLGMDGYKIKKVIRTYAGIEDEIYIITDAEGNAVREVTVENKATETPKTMALLTKPISKTVKTGDQSTVVLWAMMVLVSGLGLAVIVRRKFAK